MLHIELDEDTGIAVFEPEGPLEKADFEAASHLIDPYIELNGRLRGLIIRTRDFPGWDSFTALLGQFQFVKNHHHELTHVALVTDSNFGEFAERVGDHFVAAEVKHYPFEQFELARDWMLVED